MKTSICLTVFSLFLAASAHADSQSSMNKTIAGSSNDLERIVDDELGIVCYFTRGTTGRAVSCLPLPAGTAR